MSVLMENLHRKLSLTIENLISSLLTPEHTDVLGSVVKEVWYPSAKRGAEAQVALL